MAHRCRTCRVVHYFEDSAIEYPPPETLALFNPLIMPLLEAAREFEASAAEGAPVGTPTQFVEWLSIDVEHATGVQGRTSHGVGRNHRDTAA
jgi:hypothetical protein